MTRHDVFRETGRRVARGERGTGSVAVRLALFAAACLGVAALVLVLVVPQRADRLAAVTPGHRIESAGTFRWTPVVSEYDRQQVRVLLVTPVSGHAPPSPPGIDRFPDPETAYVSPALAHAIAEDPQLARRLPARVVGTIGTAGLSAPDALEAVVGTRDGSGGWYPGDGWGTDDVDTSAMLSAGAVSWTVAALAGLPWFVLLVVLGWLVAERFRRTCSGLALLGASRADVAVVARRGGLRTAAPSTLLGALVGVGAVRVLLPWGVLGPAAYPPGTAALGACAVGVAVVQCLVVSRLTARAAARSFADPYRGRTLGRPKPGRRWLGLAAAGAAALVAMTAARGLSASQSDPPYVAFGALLVAVLATVLGTAVGAPGLLHRMAARRGDRGSSLSGLLGWRQAAFDGGSVPGQVAALATLACVFAISSGVATLIDQADRAGQTSAWTFSLLGTSPGGAFEAARAVPGGPVLEQVPSGTSSAPGHVWGTCESLTARFGPVTTTAGEPCTDGLTYARDVLLATDTTDDGTPFRDASGAPLRRPVGMSSGAGSVVTTADPAHVSSADAPDEESAWYLTATVDDVDAVETAVLAIVPDAVPGPVQGDASHRVFGPLLRRTTAGAAALGAAAVAVAISAAGASSTVAGGFRDRLRRLGASRTTLVVVAARRTAAVTGVATVQAVVIGWLTGQAYLAMGSCYVVEWDFIGSWSAVLAGLVLAVTGAAAGVEVVRTRQRA